MARPGPRRDDAGSRAVPGWFAFVPGGPPAHFPGGRLISNAPAPARFRLEPPASPDIPQLDGQGQGEQDVERTGLKFGPLAPDSLHVCVDMQTLFSDGYPWALPWFGRILPGLEALCAHRPAQTILTRFIPASRPGEGRGAWARYYQRWAAVTLAEIGAGAIDLAPALRRFVPPARVVDKHVYSPWLEGGLDALLRDSGGDTLIISGGETDICVMATVIGAIDRGYRVVLVADGVCSFSDETHDAMLKMFARRFSEQLEVCRIAEVLDAWRR